MNDTVIIAGGGAAGLLLAAELGLAGVPAVVLERAAEAPTRSRGMLLHARAVDALRLRGIADRFRDADTPIWPRTHFALLWLDLAELGRTDYDLIVPQWRTAGLLERRATELGAEVRRGRRVVAVEQDEAGVTVRAETPQGVEELRGAYLVGCDGENSAVARLADFPFDVLAPAYYGVIGDVAVEDGERDHFLAGVYEGGQFGVLPVNPADPREVRLMTVEFYREPPDPDTPVTAEELRAAIERITGQRPPSFPEPRWLVRYGGPTRLARDYRRGRILLAGDAAHPHPPSSGNGLVTAVHDVFNLGWKLAATVRGQAPRGLLDSYHDERQPVGRRACVRALAQIPLQHPPEQAAPLRELFADLLAIDEVNRYLVQAVTNVRYPPEQAGAHPLLGAPLPDLELTGPDGPFGSAALFAAGHAVVLDLGGGLPDLSAWADRLTVAAVAPIPGLDARALLARPDGYVAWVDPVGGDHDGLALALKTWIG